MPPNLTEQHVLTLAPDAASAKNGQKLAVLRSWVTRGANEQAVWGECQGSGKNPYKVQVDLSSGDIAYRCSCPSRKQPCKHTLGLLLLLANQPNAFEDDAPPDWVAEWLFKRGQSAQKKAQKQENDATKASAPKSQTKRATARMAKITAGIEELDVWLDDIVRQGFANLQSQSSSPWRTRAARMVDAQAPGIARMLRDLDGIESSGEGWQSRLLQRLSLIHLLIEGFKRLDTLPPAVQDDIRTVIGITIKEEEVQALPGVYDHWLVLGQSVEEEENRLYVQRTWLLGQEHHQPALMLNFSHGKPAFESKLLIGTMLNGDLAFYPGSYPLRALVKQAYSSPTPITSISASPTIRDATAAYAKALATNPWLERFPLALDNVHIVQTSKQWMIRDSDGVALPIAQRFQSGYQLLARSGGYPIMVMGEWDGDTLLPLSTWINGQFAGVTIE